jgi:hypothetical protein
VYVIVVVGIIVVVGFIDVVVAASKITRKIQICKSRTLGMGCKYKKVHKTKSTTKHRVVKLFVLQSFLRTLGLA